MPKVTINLWGRPFELSVEKATCKSEELKAKQDEAYQLILKKWDVIESSLTNLKEYCLQKNGEDIGSSIENIFLYVIPKTIYISRCRKDRTCAILCNYKFDPEHGLALVFKDEKLFGIGPEDIVPL